MSLAGGYKADQLLQLAREAARHAYAPYSHFPVGAALLMPDGQVVCGVNVENVSYGLTICAERAAVVQAVLMGHTRFAAVAVWATQRPHGAVTPCGACRQVLAEFMPPEAVVIMADEATGAVKSLMMKVLLPEAFGPGSAPHGNCPDTNSSTPAG